MSSSRSLRAIGLIASLVAGASLPCRAESTASTTQTLTSSVWREPDVVGTPLWAELLALPEHLFRMAVTPLKPLVTLTERYRLDKHAYELLTNDEKTILFLPVVDVRGTDGGGFGGALTHSDLWGDGETLRLGARLQGNLDYAIRAAYSQALATLNGRGVSAKVGYGVDQNERYFGIGGDSEKADERGLKRRQLLLSTSLDLFGPQWQHLNGSITLAYRRQELAPGDLAGAPPLAADDPDVALPPRFDDHLDLPSIDLRIAIDTRDTTGLIRTGWSGQVALTAMHDLNASATSAIRGTADVAVFLPLLPRHRILMLALGGGLAAPWTAGGEIPLDGYVALGRSSNLRGYKRARFRDRYAWWAAAEYSYPVLEYYDEAGASLSFTLFTDVARAGDGAGELFAEPPRWSAGFGFRIDTASFWIARLQLGFSPEGVEFILSIGGLPCDPALRRPNGGRSARSSHGRGLFTSGLEGRAP